MKTIQLLGYPHDYGTPIAMKNCLGSAERSALDPLDPPGSIHPWLETGWDVEKPMVSTAITAITQTSCFPYHGPTGEIFAFSLPSTNCEKDRENCVGSGGCLQELDMFEE